jgi:hypothetical protein
MVTAQHEVIDFLADTKESIADCSRLEAGTGTSASNTPMPAARFSRCCIRVRRLPCNDPVAFRFRKVNKRGIIGWILPMGARSCAGLLTRLSGGAG